ncbi:MAG: MATE family efflux transporter [Verrucomicrobiales bacterium]
MSIRRQLFTLAVWPLLENLLGFAVSATDQILAGRFAGELTRMHALDALAVGGYFAWLLMIVQGAVGTGGLALISRATGAGDTALARRALGQAVLLGLSFGFLVALAAQLLIPMFLRAFSLEGETAKMAAEYLGIVSLSAPLTGFLFAANAGLRGSGDTGTPFKVMTLVNITNIFTSWLFTFGPAPWGGHGVSGLAAGTLLGWAVGAVTLAVVLWRRTEGLALDRAGLRPHRETSRRIVRVGLPSAVEILGMWLMNIALLRLVAGLPQQGVLGAHIITIRAESLSFLPGFAFGAAAATLAGQYLGLGDPSRAKAAAREAWKAGAGLMTIIGLSFILFPREIIGIFVPDSALHMNLAAPLLVMCGFCQPFLATNLILKTTFRGTGDTRAVMRYSYVSMFVFRIVLAWTLVRGFGLGLFWIWVCMFADVLVQAVVFWLRFNGGKWLRAKV